VLKTKTKRITESGNQVHVAG